MLKFQRKSERVTSPHSSFSCYSSQPRGNSNQIQSKQHRQKLGLVFFHSLSPLFIFIPLLLFLSFALASTVSRSESARSPPTLPPPPHLLLLSSSCSPAGAGLGALGIWRRGSPGIGPSRGGTRDPGGEAEPPSGFLHCCPSHSVVSKSLAGPSAVCNPHPRGAHAAQSLPSLRPPFPPAWRVPALSGGVSPARACPAPGCGPAVPSPARGFSPAVPPPRYRAAALGRLSRCSSSPKLSDAQSPTFPRSWEGVRPASEPCRTCCPSQRCSPPKLRARQPRRLRCTLPHLTLLSATSATINPSHFLHIHLLYFLGMSTHPTLIKPPVLRTTPTPSNASPRCSTKTGIQSIKIAERYSS